jgi:DNA invertase Pin-like site-specific DNA recombinase
MMDGRDGLRQKKIRQEKASRATNGPPSTYPKHSGRVNFTDSEIADIVRRMRNFEPPISIAKTYGTTKSTIIRTFKKATKDG